MIFKSGGNKINSAKFKNGHLKLLCDMIWKDKRLKDAQTKVMVPALLMDNHAHDKKKRTSEAVFCHNLSNDSPTLNDLASDCVMRTIAAPTFFPSYQQFVDGGLFAHDPASGALSLAMSPTKLNKRPEDIILLSLGTGRVLHYYDDPNHDWGYMQWVPKLTNCFWDGMLQKSEMICREILGARYHRLDPLLDKEIPMDDPLQIPILTEIAKAVDLSDTIIWIQSNLYSDKYSTE